MVSDTLEDPKLAEERQLTHDEVESLRNRNECEQRFYDHKIYEIDGMSAMAACKQNPVDIAIKALSAASTWQTG